MVQPNNVNPPHWAANEGHVIDGRYRVRQLFNASQCSMPESEWQHVQVEDLQLNNQFELFNMQVKKLSGFIGTLSYDRFVNQTTRLAQIQSPYLHKNLQTSYDSVCRDQNGLVERIAFVMLPATYQHELVVFGHLPEDILKYYSLQLLSTLDSLHQNRLAHNLISPYVILLSTDFQRAKLTEFAFINDIDSNDPPPVSGEPRYQAPEMRTQEDGWWQTGKNDIWSLGMTIFDLRGQMLDQNAQPGSLDELINLMLHEDPNTRFSAQQCMAHAWFQGGNGLPNQQQICMHMHLTAAQIAQQNPNAPPLPEAHVPLGEKPHGIKEVEADNSVSEDVNVRKLLPVMSDAERKQFIFKRFSMQKASRVFLELLEDLENQGINYTVDEKRTSISFATGEGSERCHMRVDLHAYEEGSNEIYAVVFKKQHGNIQAMIEFFQEWNETFAWAWNTSEEELYPDEDDEDDEE